ncbi:MAG: hypothetical protein JNN27_16340 [Planctomycetes bacterium]|nr:hypothetical protein [Planctomycetota bacterium]
MASFRTTDDESDAVLRPMRVAVRREDVFAEAKDMVADLAAWKLVREDAERLELHCERSGGLLGGAASVRIRVEGPDGIPSATLTLECEASGLFGRAKQVAREFLEPFRRRVG